MLGDGSKLALTPFSVQQLIPEIVEEKRNMNNGIAGCFQFLIPHPLLNKRQQLTVRIPVNTPHRQVIRSTCFPGKVFAKFVQLFDSLLAYALAWSGAYSISLISIPSVLTQVQEEEGHPPAVNASISFTSSKGPKDKKGFLWASDANRAALTLGGVGGSGKEGGGVS